MVQASSKAKLLSFTEQQKEWIRRQFPNLDISEWEKLYTKRKFQRRTGKKIITISGVDYWVCCGNCEYMFIPDHHPCGECFVEKLISVTKHGGNGVAGGYSDMIQHCEFYSPDWRARIQIYGED